ncbi:MAG: pilus assembly protein PilP [Betaproteobacteria bacterium]
MRTTVIVLLGCLAVAGCGDRHLDQVKKFVKDSDKLPPGRIPPLPEVKPYEAFSYDAYDLVDPFKPRKIVPPKAVAGAGGIQPDFNRRKEPLEAYPLENLKMVGTLQQQKVMHALVKTPDNNLFRVRSGNYIGQNFGRIVAISETTIALKEIVQDSTGSWEEKDQALQLLDELEAKR